MTTIKGLINMKKSYTELTIRTRDEEMSREILTLCNDYGTLDTVTINRKHYRIDLQDYEDEIITGKEMLLKVKECNMPIIPL